MPCLYFDSASKKCTIWNYVKPRVCKSYPFLRSIKTTEDSKTHFSISIDTRYCAGVQESADGIRIFNEDGEISDEIVDRFFGREILANYEKSILATNNFLSLVKELDLLNRAEVVFGKESSPTGGLQDAVFNFLMINETKLAKLNRDNMMRLQTAGYIDAINMHLKSLSYFRKLHLAVHASDETVKLI